jgi:hypothetical protein
VPLVGSIFMLTEFPKAAIERITLPSESRRTSKPGSTSPKRREASDRNAVTEEDETLKLLLKFFNIKPIILSMNTLNSNEPKTDFWAKIAELDAEIKRFEAAVEDFCEAKKEFLANL